jgi:hypothetical protein
MISVIVLMSLSAGACLGFLAARLLAAGSDADDAYERWREREHNRNSNPLGSTVSRCPPPRGAA